MGQGFALMAAGQLMHEYPNRKFEFINKGISGNKITDLLARWRRDCISLKPDVVSILLGINDVWHEFSGGDGVSAQMFEQLYDIVLDETRAKLPEVKIILCEPFVVKAGYIAADFHHFEPEMTTRRQIVKRLAGKHNCIFVPLQENFNKACDSAPAEHWLTDGVHPSPGGHMLIAQEWLRAFKGCLQQPS